MTSRHHELAASVATCHCGSFDGTLVPVLTIASGDRVRVRRLALPPGETADAYITMAADADLDDAAKDALRDMIALIQRRTNLDATEAYMLCSLAADLRVTQLVNEQKGCNVVLPKAALG
jgi:acetamidase/formamidase